MLPIGFNGSQIENLNGWEPLAEGWNGSNGSRIDGLYCDGLYFDSLYFDGLYYDSLYCTI